MDLGVQYKEVHRVCYSSLRTQSIYEARLSMTKKLGGKQHVKGAPQGDTPGP